MNLVSHIDHTLLKPEARPSDIEKLCREAVEYHFAAVCVNPVYVSQAADLVKGTEVNVATVVGFPFGASVSSVKAYETQVAIANGATEIDMVMAIGLFLGGDVARVEKDIATVVGVARHIPVKVIIETAFLSPDDIAKASRIAVDAGAAYVKTSTGFASRGASIEDIRIIKQTVAGRAKVKASGGIKTRAFALELVAAGADRLGTSSGVAIVTGDR